MKFNNKKQMAGGRQNGVGEGNSKISDLKYKNSEDVTEQGGGGSR